MTPARNRPVDVHWEDASARILNLVLALLDRPRSLEWVRARVDGYSGDPETVRRRFDRDREIIDDLGLVLRESEGTDAEGRTELRYHLDPEVSFLPDPVAVDAAQWDLLAPAARWVPNASLQVPVIHALQKFAAHVPAGGASGAAGGSDAVAASVPDAVDLTDADIGALHRALARNLTLTFHYWRALTEQPQVRTVEPWGVGAVDGKLYLTGHDVDRDAQRTFRLSRIADLEVTADLVRHPAPDRPVTQLVTEGLTASSTLVTASLRFTGDGAQELRSLTGGDTGQDVRIGPVDRAWLVRTAASYATDVLVTDPPDLVADIITHLEDAVGTFGLAGEETP